jgi:hypothetical protein
MRGVPVIQNGSRLSVPRSYGYSERSKVAIWSSLPLVSNAGRQSEWKLLIPTIQSHLRSAGYADGAIALGTTLPQRRDHVHMTQSTETIVAHTPGPWLVRNDSDLVDEHQIVEWPYRITAANGTDVCDLVECDTSEADACLIAAAPELLAVSELTLAFHSADTEAFVARYGGGMTTRQLCDRIRAAIAKATGGSQ